MELTRDKAYLLPSRLGPILRREGCATIDVLASRLRPGSALARDVVEAMLNHESFFFRDGIPFAQLEQALLPDFKEKRADGRRISIWCAASSHGQEPYSLAMLFAENQAEWAGWEIDILASDLSSVAVDRARSACYTQFEVQRGLSTHRLLQHFVKTGDDWTLVDNIRDRVTFRTHSLLAPPPRRAAFDIIFARNVLFYLGAEEKRRALVNLRDAMADDGVLALGAAETTFGHQDLFARSPIHRGFYKSAPAMMADAPDTGQIPARPAVFSQPGHAAGQQPSRTV
ncbi:protein-glutamate O-methyltransferase CheR [Pacificimonas sp. WHA3]|uniref:Protein-glutamate O-methyltransferase CheR n=1 Tax=Pacificimonas pallii TaxID=2827236 RepID=A0ABS6SA64_9SPHN|nr:protein-glutamate O-methyltransferase CheR [Pacificimonas pallii]MBV7255184.1 protein-glutamate O-methyltransferase CheR [Pacificimonas pallii]